MCALMVLNPVRSAGEESKAEQPNILFLLIGDPCNDSLGCAGDLIIQTPVIDRLATEGVRFDSASEYPHRPLMQADRSL